MATESCIAALLDTIVEHAPHFGFYWWIDWMLFSDTDTESCILALLDTSVKHVPYFDFYWLIDWLLFSDMDTEGCIAALLEVWSSGLTWTFSDGLIDCYS